MRGKMRDEERRGGMKESIKRAIMIESVSVNTHQSTSQAYSLIPIAMLTHSLISISRLCACLSSIPLLSSLFLVLICKVINHCVCREVELSFTKNFFCYLTQTLVNIIKKQWTIFCRRAETVCNCDLCQWIDSIVWPKQSRHAHLSVCQLL